MFAPALQCDTRLLLANEAGATAAAGCILIFLVKENLEDSHKQGPRELIFF